MSYQYRILRDTPLAAFPLSPNPVDAFFDVSGNGHTANVTGTPTIAPPLVAGGGNSYLFDSLNGFNFDAALFTGSVHDAFSLEAWFKPVTTTGTTVIIGHDDDGITYDGESIAFTTRHSDGTSASARFFPSTFEGAFYSVGVHTDSKNQLFVNGLLVAEVDLTPEQKNGYLTDSRTLVVGAGASSVVGTATIYDTVMVDGVAVYDNSLNPSQIMQHFLWGRAVRDYRSTLAENADAFWEFTDATSDRMYELHYDSAEDWSTGISTGVSVTSDALTPVFGEDGVTVESYWLTGFFVGGDEAVLDGSKIEWDSDGPVVIEASTDNETTWVVCENGREIPGLGQGVNALDLSVSFRITFPAGEPTDTVTKVRSLSIILYRDRHPRGSDSSYLIDLQGEVALSSRVYQPIEHFDYMGINLENGTAVVSSTADALPVAAVEMWVNSGDTPVTVTSSALATTIIVNGVSGRTELPGQWNHVVFDFGQGVTDFSVTGAQVGFLAVHNEAVDEARASYLYNAYTGAPQLSITDEVTVGVHDDADAVRIYAYDWSISAVG